MRDFLNSILFGIGEPSLTDDEFFLIDLDSYGWNQETYEVVLEVLTNRESISKATDRLNSYFISKGYTPTSVSTAKSNILAGGGLE